MDYRGLSILSEVDLRKTWGCTIPRTDVYSRFESGGMP